MPGCTPRPRSDDPAPEPPGERGLRAITRWIAVASAAVALLTQVVQLLGMAWRELPRP